jgi:rare lipoprotein A (peptidoglycan hydrolase)
MLRKSIGALLLAGLLWSIPAAAFGWEGHVQGTRGLGTRLRAGMWSRTVAIIAEGAKVDVLAEDRDQAGQIWYHVTAGDRDGWIYGPYLRGQATVLNLQAFTASPPVTTGTGSVQTGLATWYGPGFQGNHMANGQIFDMNDPTTTASNIFPMGAWLRVTHLETGASIVVQVRDRGGFGGAVVLDLSMAAFDRLDGLGRGIIPVSVEELK